MVLGQVVVVHVLLVVGLLLLVHRQLGVEELLAMKLHQVSVRVCSHPLEGHHLLK